MGRIVDNSVMGAALRWDIFCQVIDNHGDLGVCWRLARQIAAQGEPVRLWVDQGHDLTWLAPQGSPGVQVCNWEQARHLPSELPPGDVLIEAFGCTVPEPFVQRYANWRAADSQPARWINLEYLSAQDYVQRNHGLPSPVLSGPGLGLSKRFYYPGFSAGSGGLLRENGLEQELARFEPAAWLAAQGIARQPGQLLATLFCYEPQALPQLLAWLASKQGGLLVTAGRAAAAVRACAQPAGLTLHFLPWLSQVDFDHLLWACDLNFVRGEDSLVRALWANKPLVWQLYPQQDQAQYAKLQAYLNWLQPCPTLRAWQQTWNGLDKEDWPEPDLPSWARVYRSARQRLLAQPDLLSQLRSYCLAL